MFKQSFIDCHLRVESTPLAGARGPGQWLLPLLRLLLQPYPVATHHSSMGFMFKQLSAVSSAGKSSSSCTLLPAWTTVSWVTFPGKLSWATQADLTISCSHPTLCVHYFHSFSSTAVMFTLLAHESFED